MIRFVSDEMGFDVILVVFWDLNFNKNGSCGSGCCY